MAFRAVLLILGLSAIASGGPKKYTHYYWRDYTGYIPSDAVVGGYDELNRTTYIGQGVVANVDAYTLVPLNIIEGDTVLRAALWGHGVEALQTRILCVTSPEPDKWIATNSQNFFADTANEQLVRGGVEVTMFSDIIRYELYIGRAKVGKELITGKVITAGTYSALQVFDGQHTHQFQKFQVLVANNKYID